MEAGARCDFEWPDARLARLGARGLRIYGLDQRVSQPTDGDLEDVAALAEVDSALRPLSIVFIECRQYLHRRRIADAVDAVHKLLSPALDPDRALLERLDAYSATLPADAHGVTLAAFLIQRVDEAVAAWEQARTFKATARNALVACVVAALQGGEPYPDDPHADARASQRVSQVLRRSGRTRPYTFD